MQWPGCSYPHSAHIHCFYCVPIIKEKKVRANNAPFMDKALCKAIMTRSRLRNRFLKNPNIFDRASYKKQRSFCVSLLRNTKRNFYKNLDLKTITNNKSFWKTIKPLFSEKKKHI